MSIHIKKSHRGLLHRDMGVPQGKKLTMGQMQRAAKNASPAEKKRIVFAENARSWGRNKK